LQTLPQLIPFKITESESEDEDDEIIYNPKNLPLGWDGKPIPYWLYKLHGLNINYNCEICGNQTYRGPKAFQRHFSVSALWNCEKSGMAIALF